MDQDLSLYGFIGREILNGKILYRDLWDIKPPGIYYLSALALKIFGDSSHSLIIIGLLFSILFMIILYLFCIEFFDFKTAFVISILFSLISSDPNLLIDLPNTEVYINFFILCGIFSFLLNLKTSKDIFIILSGICIGIASIFKTVVFPHMFIIIILLITKNNFLNNKNNIKILIKYLLYLIMPTILIWIFCSLYFFTKNSFNDFFEANFLYTLKYSENFILKIPYLFICLNFLKGTWPIFLFAFIFLLINIKLNLSNFKKFQYLFFLTSLLSVMIPSKYYPHYYYLMFPSILIICGDFLFNLDKLKFKFNKTVFILLSSLLILLLLYSQYNTYLKKPLDDINFSKHPYFIQNIYARELGLKLKEQLQKEDLVFTFVPDTGINFYSGKSTPTKYFSYTTIFIGNSDEIYKKKRQIINDLILKNPSVIIISPIYTLPKDVFLELDNLITDKYILWYEYATFKIYKIRN